MGKSMVSERVATWVSPVQVFATGIQMKSVRADPKAKRVATPSYYCNLQKIGPPLKLSLFYIEKYHNSHKYAHPLFEEPLEFIGHRCIFRRLHTVHVPNPSRVHVNQMIKSLHVGKEQSSNCF